MLITVACFKFSSIIINSNPNTSDIIFKSVDFDFLYKYSGEYFWVCSACDTI